MCSTVTRHLEVQLLLQEGRNFEKDNFKFHDFPCLLVRENFHKPVCMLYTYTQVKQSEHVNQSPDRRVPRIPLRV